MSELVDKLLSYTTIESPDVQVVIEAFALDAATGDALAAMKERFEERGVVVDAPKTGITLMGDKRLFVEALKNLLDNAVKFNSKPAPLVILRTEAEGDWAAITLGDDGPGIPPEEHERVFSRFHQVEKDFTGQQEGMGLGLAFVRKVAILHGGNAVLRSKLGTGTEVTMTVPRRRDP